MKTRVFLAAVACVFHVACGGRDQVKAAPRLPPASPAAVTKLAQGVEAARKPEGRARAMGLLNEAVQVDASLWEAHYNLGILNAEAGNLTVAERELGEAFRLAPNAEDVAIALAEVRLRSKDAASAIAPLSTFVKSNPKAQLAPVALIAALREAGKVDAAIDLAHRVLIRRSRDPRALTELALSHLARGETDTAELLIQEALKVETKSAIVERTAGLIALRKGDDAVAFRHFAKATDLDPNDATARLNIGTVLLAAGVYDKAAEQFRAVHDANPDDVAATLGLAAARRGLGKRDSQGVFEEVEKLLTSVLEREPDNLSAIFNLGVLYADYLKRPGDAQRSFRRFLEVAPSGHPARADAEKWLSAQATPSTAAAPLTPSAQPPPGPPPSAKPR